MRGEKMIEHKEKIVYTKKIHRITINCSPVAEKLPARSSAIPCRQVRRERVTRYFLPRPSRRGRRELYVRVFRGESGDLCSRERALLFVLTWLQRPVLAANARAWIADTGGHPVAFVSAREWRRGRRDACLYTCVHRRLFYVYVYASFRRIRRAPTTSPFGAFRRCPPFPLTLASRERKRRHERVSCLS